MESTTQASSQRHIHNLFPCLFVLFVVKKPPSSDDSNIAFLRFFNCEGNLRHYIINLFCYRLHRPSNLKRKGNKHAAKRNQKCRTEVLAAELD